MRSAFLIRDDVKSWADEMRAQKKRIVFTNGCFDILHIGHTRYLQQARILGDCLIVGVNSDQSVRSLKKGPDRPINSEKDRSEILLALRFVDAVSIFGESTPLELIKMVRPDFLVKGGDWQPDQIVGRDFVESYGGVVKSIPLIQGYSTTSILARV